MNEHEGKPGFFGKIPLLGDFVSRRLPFSFLEPWDHWLQHCLASSQTQLGDSWLRYFLTSPIWRFALSPGVCGDAGVAGVMIPSVDKVGRYFPLTLASFLLGQQDPFSFFQGAKPWFDGAESVLLSALKPPFDLQGFDDDVATLGAPGLRERDHSWIDQEIEQGDACLYRLATLENANDAVSGLAGYWFKRMFPAGAFWWTEGTAQTSAMVLVTERLPAPELFGAMLGYRGFSEISRGGRGY